MEPLSLLLRLLTQRRMEDPRDIMGEGYGLSDKPNSLYKEIPMPEYKVDPNIMMPPGSDVFDEHQMDRILTLQRKGHF